MCIASTGVYSQNLKIKGHVVEDNDPLLAGMTGVFITLHRMDSTYVSGAVSDRKGDFSLAKINPGDYYLSISYIGYEQQFITLKNLREDVDLGIIKMVELTTELEEVTVTAGNMVQKTDRMVVLPTQSALKNAYDSYELLNNLNIPRLRVDPINKKMEAEGRAVQVRINGIKASAAEVSAILAKNVIRIDVIENPGKRYGEEELGAVVDLIVRRREYGGQVNLQTTNSPYVLFSDNNLSVKLNKGKSQWGLSYNHTFRGFEKMRKDIDETYHLENETIRRIHEGINDTIRFFNHNLDLSYNLYDQDKYIFNVIFRNRMNDQPYDNQSAKLYNYGQADFIYSKTRAGSSDYSPSLDIYYLRKLPKNQSVQLNLVGTLIHSDVSRNYREYTGAGNDLALIRMEVDGEKQSLIGEVIYDKDLENIKLSGGMRHNRMYTENKYQGTNAVVSDMQQSITSAFFEFQGKMKEFGYFGSLGLTRSYFKEGNQSHTYYNFTPAIRLTYNLRKYGFISYRLNTSPKLPSLGSLTNVEQALDTIQIVRGNPGLKPYYDLNNTLNYTYTRKKFTGTFTAGYHYEKGAIMESLFTEGNKMIIMDENQKSLQLLRLHTSLALNGMDIGNIKNFLTLYAGLGYFNYGSYGKSYSHNYDNFSYNIALVLKYNAFSLMGEYNKKFNRLFGETIHKGENVTAFILTYTRNKLQAGAGITFPFTNNYRTGSERISTVAPNITWIYIKEAGQLAFIRLNYNFEFGKKHRAGQKKLNNSDADSGIINTNR
jgi:hypothetical protein